VSYFSAIALRGAFPQICKILRFCDFFVVLSFPVMVILFFHATPRSRSDARLNERSVIFNEEMVGGRERVTTDNNGP